jgi:hypothetical protein
VSQLLQIAQNAILLNIEKKSTLLVSALQIINLCKTLQSALHAMTNAQIASDQMKINARYAIPFKFEF